MSAPARERKPPPPPPPDLSDSGGLDSDLDWLNCSAQAFVATIGTWAESIVGQRGYPTFSSMSYSFYHSKQIGGESAAMEAAYNQSLAQCQGTGTTCRRFVLEEASVGSKGLAQYLTGVVSDVKGSPSWLPVTGMFGWKPAHTFTVQQYDAHIFKKNSSIRLECGGGSGAGFQVYCNGTLVLSAGGGGGGGMEGRPSRKRGAIGNYSVGGGGGGGVQFRYFPLATNTEGEGGMSSPLAANLSEWVSVGGGSGCGTCNGGNGGLCDESEERLLCGQRMDDDSSVEGTHSTHFNHSLAWCRRHGGDIHIMGGGGGGGGTSECCHLYQIGYGFSFHMVIPSLPLLIPSPHHHDNHHHHDYDDQQGGDDDQPWLPPFGPLPPNPPHHHHHDHSPPPSHHEDDDGNDHHDHHRSSKGPSRPPHFKKRWSKRRGRVLMFEPDVAVQQQLKYDHLFRYLYGASLQCEKGFQDWCCVCENAQQLIMQDDEPSLSWFANIACCSCDDDVAAAANATDAPGSRPWRPEDDLPHITFQPIILHGDDGGDGGRCELGLTSSSSTAAEAKARKKGEEKEKAAALEGGGGDGDGGGSITFRIPTAKTPPASGKGGGGSSSLISISNDKWVAEGSSSSTMMVTRLGGATAGPSSSLSSSSSSHHSTFVDGGGGVSSSPSPHSSTSSTNSVTAGGVGVLVLLVVCAIISFTRLKWCWYPLFSRGAASSSSSTTLTTQQDGGGGYGAVDHHHHEAVGEGSVGDAAL